ncbi:MAG: ankyrin repeat domain-containing protein [Alphaproteobacteria bacterium]|nr:ankyrin repeat domain-containing protein [Alphaproteobacteria bacterium]
MDTKEQEEKKRKERENAIASLKDFNYKEKTLNDFKKLLEKDIPLETPDENDELPIVKAIYAQNIGIIKYLISQKVNLYATDLSGQTTMMICARNGFLDIAKLLLTAGYAINRSIPTTDQTVMGLTVWNNHLEMVQWLLNNGANVDMADNQGWTPLMIAAYSGFTDIVTELLKHHPDTDKKNNRGSTAFDLAVFRNHPDIVRLLKN